MPRRGGVSWEQGKLKLTAPMRRIMGATKKIMARYNEKGISYAIQERLMNLFCEMLAKLKSKRAIHDFLKDLLNRQERIMMIRRLLIAEMLEQGRTYRDIRNRLKCGNTTIAKVERWLSFGRGGFKIAIKLFNKK